MDDPAPTPAPEDPAPAPEPGPPDEPTPESQASDQPPEPPAAGEPPVEDIPGDQLPQDRHPFDYDPDAQLDFEFPLGLAADELKALAQSHAHHPSRYRWAWPILRSLGDEEPDVLVEGLIHAGDQVLLAAPPKSGKSFLALELAMKLAVGKGTFISADWKITKPRRVLYVSAEMPAGMVAQRLEGHEKLCEADPAVYGNHLFFIFPVRSGPPERSLLHREAITSAINFLRPDVVILDTLIQMHSSDENDNVEMGYVMRELRTLCRLPPSISSRDKEHGDRVAHVVLHHNRKASGYERGIALARGAGAIHGEVDVALVLETSSRDPSKATLGVSTRQTDAPPMLKLDRVKTPALHYMQEAEADPVPQPAADEGVLARAHAAAQVAFVAAMAEAGIVWQVPSVVLVRDVEVLIGDHMFKALAESPASRRPKDVRLQIQALDPRITPKQFEKAWSRLLSLNLIRRTRGTHACTAVATERANWLQKLWPVGSPQPERVKKSRGMR